MIYANIKIVLPNGNSIKKTFEVPKEADFYPFARRRVQRLLKPIWARYSAESYLDYLKKCKVIITKSTD
jgi:hypothetical protein